MESKNKDAEQIVSLGHGNSHIVFVVNPKYDVGREFITELNRMISEQKETINKKSNISEKTAEGRKQWNITPINNKTLAELLKDGQVTLDIVSDSSQIEILSKDNVIAGVYNIVSQGEEGEVGFYNANMQMNDHTTSFDIRINPEYNKMLRKLLQTENGFTMCPANSSKINELMNQLPGTFELQLNKDNIKSAVQGLCNVIPKQLSMFLHGFAYTPSVITPEGKYTPRENIPAGTGYEK